MAEELSLFLEYWNQWLDDLMAVGVAYPGAQLRQRIYLWVDQARLLGFNQDAELATTLLDSEQTAQLRASAFATLLVRHELLNTLNKLHNIEQALEL